GRIKQRFKEEYIKLREDYSKRQEEKVYIPLSEARKNHTKIDWKTTPIVKPKFLGNKVFNNYPLEEIRKYIDWTPFFQTWMLAGRFPGILSDPVVGTEAQRLYDDAQAMLDQIVQSRSLQANGVVGFYPAFRNETDDVILSRKEGEEAFATFHFLRQQNKKAQGLPNFSLADFIAPADSARQDYIGLFAVTAG